MDAQVALTHFELETDLFQLLVKLIQGPEENEAHCKVLGDSCKQVNCQDHTEGMEAFALFLV